MDYIEKKLLLLAREHAPAPDYADGNWPWLKDVMLAAVAMEREACAKLCEDYAQEELAAEMQRIQGDDWSHLDPVDEESANPDDNDNHPITLAENTAKAHAWMMTQCGHRIRKRGNAPAATKS